MIYDLVVEPTFYEHVNELRVRILANQKRKNKHNKKKNWIEIVTVH